MQRQHVSLRSVGMGIVGMMVQKRRHPHPHHSRIGLRLFRVGERLRRFAPLPDVEKILPQVEEIRPRLLFVVEPLLLCLQFLIG